MSIKDKLERILREMHIMVSRGQISEIDEAYVLIPKKEMQQLLNGISQTINEMMEYYELTEEGRNRAQLGAEKQRMEIIRNANHQAQDIYAASVLYSEDALGRIQNIINEAEKSSKEILITQLEDLKDSSKYMRLIEERNREIAKEELKKQETIQKRKYRSKTKEQTQEDTAEDFTEEMVKESPKEDNEEKIVYEKPVIKVNEQYFQKLEQIADDEEQEDNQKEKHQKLFSFGRK